MWFVDLYRKNWVGMAAIRVSLKRRLKAFKEPDTRNRSVGYAEGTFNVFDKRRNYPTDDTDYVLIDHPELFRYTFSK